jgi:hypothetical protein
MNDERSLLGKISAAVMRNKLFLLIPALLLAAVIILLVVLTHGRHDAPFVYSIY